MKMTESWEQSLTENVAAVEEYLDRVLSDRRTPPLLRDAMIYAVKPGGKRLRPYLTLSFCALCGGRKEDALPLAAAVEMVHSYSLIHDDLPCMDDDNLRRGKPATHIQFGEANGLLAGDALLTLAFGSVAASGLAPERVKAGLAVLGEKAGACGMVGGQVLDLAAEENRPDREMLTEIILGKTSALIEAACMMGCAAAGAGDEQFRTAEAYGRALGFTFQLTDDLLDVLGDEKTLGKPIHSDEEQNKTNFVTLLGAEKTRQMAGEQTQKAIEALKGYGPEADLLRQMARDLLKRVS